MAFRPPLPPSLDDVQDRDGDVEGYMLLPVVETTRSSTWLVSVNVAWPLLPSLFTGVESCDIDVSTWLCGVKVALKPLMPPSLDCDGDVERCSLAPVVESALSSACLYGTVVGFRFAAAAGAF